MNVSQFRFPLHIHTGWCNRNEHGMCVCVCVFRRTHMHTPYTSMHVDNRGSIHVQVCQLSILNKTSVIAPPHVVAALLRREDDADGGDEDDEDIHPTSALVSELDTLAYVWPCLPLPSSLILSNCSSSSKYTLHVSFVGSQLAVTF